MFSNIFGRPSPPQPLDEKTLLQQRIQRICDESHDGIHLGDLESKVDGRLAVALVMITQSSMEEKKKAFELTTKWTDLTQAAVNRAEFVLHDEFLPRDWTYLDFKLLRKTLREPRFQTASQIAEAMNQARADRGSPRNVHWWRYSGDAHDDEYTAEEIIRAVKYLDWRLPGLRVKHSRAWTEADIEGIWRAFVLQEPLASLAKRLNAAGQFTVGKDKCVDFDRLSVEKIIDDKLQVVSEERLWSRLQIRSGVLPFFGIEWRGRKFGKDVAFSSDNGGNSGPI